MVKRCMAAAMAARMGASGTGWATMAAASAALSPGGTTLPNAHASNDYFE